jgi:hypothetical protein
MKCEYERKLSQAAWQLSVFVLSDELSIAENMKNVKLDHKAESVEKSSFVRSFQQRPVVAKIQSSENNEQ